MATSSIPALSPDVTRDGAKQCKTCKKHLPLTAFTKDKNKPDGLNRTCSPCLSARWAELHPQPPKPFVPEGMRLCGRCGIPRNPSDFGKCKSRPDGLYPVCKPCRTERRAAEMATPEGRQKHRDYYTAYRGENPDKISGYGIKFRKNNRESIRASQAKCLAADPGRSLRYEQTYRERHPQKVYDFRQAYHKANAEKERAYGAVWRASHLDLLAAKSSARRAMKMRATPSWASSEAMLEFYIEARSKSAETGVEYHVDHIVPLKSKFVCGLHCEANLQVITGSENQSKCNRYWPDMGALATPRILAMAA